MEDESRVVKGDKNGNGRDFSRVQVIDRAVSILRALRDTGGLNLSQLARQVGLARSTVHRIVSTLEAENLVATNERDGRIELGIELISLGSAVKGDIRRELRPFLESLSDEVDETIDLAILNKDHLLFMEQITRPHRLLVAFSWIGVSFPLHCTANGKAMLAALPVDQVEHLVPERLEVFTPHTIQTRAQLMQELEAIRATGIAFDREEHSLGICAVGAVVRARLGELAAISIPVPSVRFYGHEEGFVSALRRTREAINARFERV